MQTKNWISCVILLLSSVGSAQLSATVKMMSDDEAAAFEKECAADPQCADELSKLKAKNNKYQADLDTLCKKDAAACARRRAEDERKFLGHAAECADLAKDCREQVNAVLDELERSRLDTRWCKDNAQQCAQLTQEREARKASGKTWCDTHSDLCTKAQAEQTQRKKKQEQHERELEQKRKTALAKKKIEEDKLSKQSMLDAKKRRELLIKEEESHVDERQREADRNFIAEGFKCAGSAEDCIEHINAFMEQQIKWQYARRCTDRPKSCAAAKVAKKTDTKPSDAKPKTWCEDNGDICEKAVQRYSASLAATSK